MWGMAAISGGEVVFLEIDEAEHKFYYDNTQRFDAVVAFLDGFHWPCTPRCSSSWSAIAGTWCDLGATQYKGRAPSSARNI